MKKSYLIQGIDEKLWKEFKTACVHYGVSMRTSFMANIQAVVHDYTMYQINKTFAAKERRKGGKKR